MGNVFLSTRLFPKSQGADAYVVSGLAAKCDWVVLSDHKAPTVFLKFNHAVQSPATVFLSLRNLRAALPFFVSDVLPKLSKPFVLISGSEDVTLPNQIDKRWPPLNEGERGLVNAILYHRNLKHWFVENLDERVSDKVTPIPLGMVYPESLPTTVACVDIPPLAMRSLNVLCAHRVRDGQQWQVRKDVTEIALKNWQNFTTVITDEVTEPEFIELIRQHSFVICAQGGGLDPSPKAWLALYYGAIPIIKSSALDGAYKQLPVIHIDDWHADALSTEKLQQWREALAYHYDTLEGRRNVLEKLTLEYWWQQIVMAK